MTPRKLGKILVICCAGAVGAFCILMVAAKIALDRAPQYQSEMKNWFHVRTGYHIAFARVAPALRWYGPELYFTRLELRSRDDRRVLARAAGGRVGADVWQLIRSGKLYAGRIELDEPEVSLMRTAPGEFALGGEIMVGGGGSPPPTLRLDDLPAGTVAIRRGTLTLMNVNSTVQSLVLRQVNLQLRRGDGLATLTVEARLPSLLGQDVRLTVAARGGGAWSTLAWSARGRTRHSSLGGFRQLMPGYLNRLTAGSGDFVVSADGVGADLSRMDLNVDAQNVSTQLTDGPSVTFQQIAGALSVSHAGDRWSVAGRHVRALRAGFRDPDSEFDVTWRRITAGLLELHAGANYLRAETLLPLAGLLPQKDLRERLQEISPTGEWLAARVDLQRENVASPWRLDVRARFRGAGFAPVLRVPGLRGLSGVIVGTEAGGRVDIEALSGMFSWPVQLSQPVPLQVLKTTLYWKRTTAGLLVATPSLELRTRDAALQGRFAWYDPTDGDSPELTMAASIDNGNAAAAHLYLPRGLLNASVFSWLNRAFVAGHLAHADAVIQGPIRHFPFRDGTGLFLVRAEIDGMTLDYREGWPRAENLKIGAEFRNEGLTVQLHSGTIKGATVSRGTARFVDFKNAELELHATASGQASDALAFLRATPLDDLAGHAFSGVDATGPVELEAALFLPFKQFDQRRVLVHARMLGVSLNRPGSPLIASDLMGDADIDGAQVAHADVHGKFLGGTFQMQARSPRNRPVSRTVLTFNGTVAGDALHSALSFPASLPIGGSTDWHAVLRMAPEPARERSLRIATSLAGLELNLPEPLAKPAGRPLPSTFDVQWPASGALQVRMALGGLLRGQLNIDTGANGPTLGRAALSFGSTAADSRAFSDTQLVNSGGHIDRLDLGGWLRLYAPEKGAKPLTSFLKTARFDVAQLDYLGLSFFDLSLELAAIETGWRVGVTGPNVVGTIFVPGDMDAAEPLAFDFRRLKFVGGATTVADAPTGAPVNLEHIPAVNFAAKELIWDERQLGEVHARLRKLNDGIALKELSLSSPALSAEIKGEWRGRDAGAGRLEGTLASSDVSAALKQLGYDAVIEAKNGKMDFDLNWAGVPTAEALSLASGSVTVGFDHGQITGLNPGAGRVVGLASVAALRRRLALDFSDLTDKGFAFDTVRGNFDLHDGSAFTDDILVKGPAADIGLIGRVGLKNKDYDQTAVVTGNVNSSLPLAAFAGGPVIGAAVLVFTQVFKQPLRGLARGYYRITGTWDNPTVERIKSAEAAAAAAEATK